MGLFDSATITAPGEDGKLRSFTYEQWTFYQMNQRFNNVERILNLILGELAWLRAQKEKEMKLPLESAPLAPDPENR